MATISAHSTTDSCSSYASINPPNFDFLRPSVRQVGKWTRPLGIFGPPRCDWNPSSTIISDFQRPAVRESMISSTTSRHRDRSHVRLVGAEIPFQPAEFFLATTTHSKDSDYINLLNYSRRSDKSVTRAEVRIGSRNFNFLPPPVRKSMTGSTPSTFSGRPATRLIETGVRVVSSSIGTFWSPPVVSRMAVTVPISPK